MFLERLKKIQLMRFLLILFFFISSLTYSQFSIEGTLVPNVKSDWVILYKVEGAKQNYLLNTKLVKDTLVIEGKKQPVAKFKFTLPETTKPGVYRITYRLKGVGFVDLVFNKENISFALNPDYPEQTISFSESDENILYQNYLREISTAQQQLDSIQVTAIRNPSINQKEAYQNALALVNNIQNAYTEASKGKYVQPFIVATSRVNPKNVETSGQEYMKNMTAKFFDKMDFKNETLLNSSFLVDRITDYVFYVNLASDEETQQQLYKNSVATALSKIEDVNFRADVIEFLIKQFAKQKKITMVDYLFENYFDKLPESLQNKKFKSEQLADLMVVIGRKAPDFSWENNGKKMTLSSLQDAENYILVFWSTGCSHCLNEIPKLHTFLKDKSNIKVVAFSLEKNDFKWNKMKGDLPNWHHVLGLNKWENKIARTYNINATPTYFVLDKNKKIIAKPDHLKDVKAYVDKM
jgi:thiol-disulfide isomerase/thioredoxin